VLAAVKEDGKEWVRWPELSLPDLSRTVKVGVFASSTSPRPFRAEFEQLTLTLPRK
jgi:hypothetical protein